MQLTNSRRAEAAARVHSPCTATPRARGVVPRGPGAEPPGDETLAMAPPRPRLLSAEAALAAMRARVPAWPAANMLAFYSSALGGIVVDPAFMSVAVDDHLVHRGHAVFVGCCAGPGGARASCADLCLSCRIRATW